MFEKQSDLLNKRKQGWLASRLDVIKYDHRLRKSTPSLKRGSSTYIWLKGLPGQLCSSPVGTIMLTVMTSWRGILGFVCNLLLTVVLAWAGFTRIGMGTGGDCLYDGMSGWRAIYFPVRISDRGLERIFGLSLLITATALDPLYHANSSSKKADCKYAFGKEQRSRFFSTKWIIRKVTRRRRKPLAH